MENRCIQEQCEMQVPVSLTIDVGLNAALEFHALLEPESLFMEWHGLAVTHSLSHNKNGVTMIQIMNPNPIPITVHKGEKVGKFHPVDEHQSVCVVTAFRIHPRSRQVTGESKQHYY